MFSEYASRFLAQSQSRFSNFAGQPADANDTTNNNSSSNNNYSYAGRGPAHRQDDYSSSNAAPSRRGHAPHRSYLARGNPYQQQSGGGSRFGNLAFASRISAAPETQAPLFHSTLDEFREEDDEQERDREAADLYALQRSRRVAVADSMADTADSEEADSRGSLDQDVSGSRPYDRRGRGIKSSWTGTRSMHKKRGVKSQTLQEEDAEGRRDNYDDNDDSVTEQSQDSKGKMVDIGLESRADLDDDDDDPPASLLGAPDDTSPPPFQRFRSETEHAPFLRDNGDMHGSIPRSSMDEQQPHETAQASAAASPEGELFLHDPFFAWIFLISFAGMLSTFVLVWLNTSPGKSPVGDTIYTTLQKSFNMLAIDTVVAVMVSFVWLAALRSFVRPLVNMILVAVPVIMLSFSLYSFVSSFQGRTEGASFQDKVMRWLSLVPAASCIMWLWLVVKGRRSIQQAVEILQFSSKILAQNSGLLLVGFGCLALIVVWTWAWLGMFTRVFMGGYFSKSLVRFVIRLSSWWLGAAFVLMYMWTLSIINAVHRATTAATVSQWYFHRNAGPATPSNEIVAAALHHAATSIFGTVCESTLLSLLVRAPLIFLPRRLGAAISNLAAFWIPTPIIALTNPLTVTYAAIHSQNLSRSARGLEQMEVISPAIPTTTLTPRAFRVRGGHVGNGLLPYRLAKLLLVATRLIMATGLGFAGWVLTAKQLRVQLPDGMGMRGSAYAYVVGLMASFIGYSVMGAMEGILSGIVDAVLICYGSERRMDRGHGRFCLEAAYLFGERTGGETGDYD